MLKHLLLIAITVLISSTAFAIPGYRGKLKHRQPDGTEITYFIIGDENYHEYVSIDGYRLLHDKFGIFRYVKLDNNGELKIVNGIVAHDPELRDCTELEFVASLQPANELRKLALRPARTIKRTSQAGNKHQVGSFPTIGESRQLVILVDFSDKRFTLGQKFHERMLNEMGFSEDGATGSAADYFKDQSSGLFRPTFDVVGPITLSRSYSYYGADNPWQGKDIGVADMIVEACNLANEAGVDFSKYDSDNDGKVDMVYFIYAGYGQNYGGDPNTIWPHEFNLTSLGIKLSLNEKKIDTYACSAELLGNSGMRSSGIGMLCHEFSHVLGLADLYNTTDASQYIFGSYDLMDMGAYNNDGRTPPSYSSFERMAVAWLTPTIISTPFDNYTLKALSSSNEAFLVPTNNENEFYLLENRQREDWDTYLPGEGMMITHVDFDQLIWKSNKVNDEPEHPRYYLIPADNDLNADLLAGYETETFDLYPFDNGISINNSLTDTSTPAAKLYSGEVLDRWITDISLNEGIITFNYMSNYLITPADVAIKDMSTGGFTATWQAVEKAKTYEVTLWQLNPTNTKQTALQESFGGVIAGSDSAPDPMDISADIDKYTERKGYSGENLHQAGGWLQIGSETNGGRLNLPELELNKYKGAFAILIHAKAASGKQPVMNISANGQSARTRITSAARTYVMNFESGISSTKISVIAENERVLVDSIAVVRGTEYTMPDGAKKIATTGSPEIVETEEVEPREFEKNNATTISDITDTYYTFTNLDAKTYYSFSVKAVSENRKSKNSEEIIVNLSQAADIDCIARESSENNITDIYTLEGMKVAKAERPGIYIIIRNGKAIKKYIK